MFSPTHIRKFLTTRLTVQCAHKHQQVSFEVFFSKSSRILFQPWANCTTLHHHHHFGELFPHWIHLSEWSGFSAERGEPQLPIVFKSNCDLATECSTECDVKKSVDPNQTDARKLIVFCSSRFTMRIIITNNIAATNFGEFSLPRTVWLLCWRVQLFEIFCLRFRRSTTWIVYWRAALLLRASNMRLATKCRLSSRR